MLHPSYSDLINVVNSEVEPGEQPVVQSRYSIVIAAAKRARQLIAEDSITQQARQKANEMMQQAEERSRELKRSANEYCEDALRRTEEAVAEAYDEIKKSRARFRAVAGGGSQNSRQPYDAEADE